MLHVNKAELMHLRLDAERSEFGVMNQLFSFDAGSSVRAMHQKSNIDNEQF